MGVKAFVQKGRGKPGLILPAGAVARINDSKDRSALIRAAQRQAAEEVVDKPSVRPVQPPPRTEPVAPEVVVVTPAVAGDIVSPDPDPVEETVPEPTKPDPGLAILTGVGPTMRQRLNNYGFHTIEQLAAADPMAIDEVPGAKGRGEKWVAEARRMLNG